ncbi:MAG: hypothetical protein IVW53_10305 [Chloroflexi bacterium]|nr:hypothetical protein [Chloroflexota bacterium]
MKLTILLPAITALVAALFALALIDQWRERRKTFQAVWAVGMVFFAVASGCEAIAGAAGWNELLYRLWYLTGAIWAAGWLGLGTAFLLARTRFSYTYAACLLLAGVFTILTQAKYEYPGSGVAPAVYLVAGLGLAVAVAFESYFSDRAWPRIAAIGVVGATVLSVGLMAVTALPAPGYSLDPLTNIPTGTALPGSIRLLTPFLNITGGLALILGALFSAYVFMPKRRVLAYSLDPGQKGDEFLFNLLIAPVAIVVNFVASLPGAIDALLHGRLHSRVPATILIALGALVASSTDTLNRFGSTELFQAGKLVAVLLLLAGFLVSIEVFREIRVPFTGLRIATSRQERSNPATEESATSER